MNGLLKLFFPPKCVFCGKILADAEKHVCRECEKAVRYCGVPYAAKKPYYERGYAAFRYEGDVRSAVLRYKFSGAKAYAEYFASEMAEVIKNAGITADVMTFPPSSRFKAFVKGYDHAFLLAKKLSEKTGIPVERLLYKKRRTKPMYGLDAAERRANISGSVGFTGRVEDKTVLIADDILTTGATASECARILNKNGAKAVYVIAAAAKK